VAVELSVLSVPPLVLFVAEDEDVADDFAGERFEVLSSLDDDDKRHWWKAVAEEATSLVQTDQLAQLDSWWESVKRVRAAPPASSEELPVAGRSLFTALALAGRPWPANDLASLGGTNGEVEALVVAGAALADGGFLALAPAWQERAAAAAAEAEGSLVETVASALVTGSGGGTDPWALARASHLLALSAETTQAIEAADAMQARAMLAGEDPLVRREILRVWLDVVQGLPALPRRELLLRSAERALTAGEPDEASECLRGATTSGTNDVRILTLQGRALAATGDLVAARVALDRAQALASEDATGVDEAAVEARARVAIEQAELAYMAGDPLAARGHAELGISLASSPAAKLNGRNTLGKLLLGESRWDDADRHFAEDALTAAAHGDTSGEFRARVNRGIALQSKGRMEEARALFESVLAEGQRRGEPRACAYALSNLALLAYRGQEYGVALGHWVESFKLVPALRNPMSAAVIVANLAALRCRLGLVDHAEQALAFGKRTLGHRLTVARASQFELELARVALLRGRTVDGRRHVESAILVGQSAGDREVLGECFRMAARIALEDGDLPRAQEAIDRAHELASRDAARAEIVLLQALQGRAAGNNSLGVAEKALTLARAAGDEILILETHVLCAELARDAGNGDGSIAHLAQAIALRDQIVARVPHEIRANFLARRDMSHLARLHAQAFEPGSSPLIDEGDTTRGPDFHPFARAARPAASSAASSTSSGSAASFELVGDDPAIRGLLAAVRKVARSTSTVLIRGESGTGKELVAMALHRASGRAAGPMVTVNCAALVETLLLSELFGHEKGAFTGAFARRRGRFELAEGGTLFLDEIGDISPRTQVALLRVLQERTFERVGGTSAIRADVRIVCATHRDLRRMVERGEFREDLYYRLRGITLEVPPLRQRLGDLPRISAHLLARIAAERGEPVKDLDEDALELLGRHTWPGNIRELENALRAASLFAETSVITDRDLSDNVDDLRPLALPASRSAPAAVASSAGSGRISSPPPPLGVPCRADSSETVADPPSGVSGPDETDSNETDGPLPQIEATATAVAYAQVRQGCVSLSDMKRQIERDCIARALAETRGNITRAAAILGMKRPRLSQLVKQYALAAISSEA
jgi:transcriptional regulator with GAF, ATPase, and Fis domain/tetratricopeptide (TPR) repeat protein